MEERCEKAGVGVDQLAGWCQCHGTDRVRVFLPPLRLVPTDFNFSVECGDRRSRLSPLLYGTTRTQVFGFSAETSYFYGSPS